MAITMTEHLTPPLLCKALADETRARIALLAAREGELCVCELVGALGESQPKVSRHLAQLRNSGLLADRRQGQWVYYRLHPDLPDWVHELLTLMLDSNRHWLDPQARRLAGMSERPGRASLCG
jgi:ArsR family transcriptional regulator